jgi:hypothetical protein
MSSRFTSSQGSDVLIYLYLELVFDLIILGFILWNAFDRPRRTPLRSTLRGDGIGYFLACADLFWFYLYVINDFADRDWYVA